MKEWGSLKGLFPIIAPFPPLLAAHCSAGVKELTAKTTRLHCNELNNESTAQDLDNRKHHCMDSKASFALAETKEMLTERTNHCGNDARVLTLTKKAINQWTAPPFSATETWIKTTKQKPDLLPMKKAPQTNTT